MISVGARLAVASLALALSVNVSPAVAANDLWTAATALRLLSPGEPPATVDVSQGYDTQAGEPLTHRAVGNPAPPAACAYMGATAWWLVRGNGQQIAVSTAQSDPDTVVAVYRSQTDANGIVTQAPTGTNFVTCNDDSPAGGTFSSLASFPSDRGAVYLIQVGGKDFCAAPASCVDKGRIRVLATARRPANDDRSAAKPLQAGQPSAGDDNIGATTEPGEVPACGPTKYSATVWYRWTAPAIGDARFAAAAFWGGVAPDTVLSVYAEGAGQPLACNNDSGVFAGPSALTLRVSPGSYLMQVGAAGEDGNVTIGQGGVQSEVQFTADLDLDDDGSAVPDDCNDGDPSIRPGAIDVVTDDIDQDCSGTADHDGDDDGYDRVGALRDCDDGNRSIHPDALDIMDNGVDEDCDAGDRPNPDRDGDGNARPGDCNDSDPRIRQGATDLPGDGIDQDCADGDADFPVLSSRILVSFAPQRTRDVVSGLFVQPALAGTRVRIACSGPGCAFAARTIRVKRNARRLELTRYTRKLRLNRQNALEIRLQRPGYVGPLSRWTFKNLAKPVRHDRCRWPDERTARRCPL